jgi:Amino acid kinase family
MGVNAEAIDAWDAGIFTDSHFGDANLLPNYRETTGIRVSQGIKETSSTGTEDDESIVSIQVVTGFLGHDPNASGHITTLGRGGSDLTATAVGAALNADEVWVWKDIDGILSADRVSCHALSRWIMLFTRKHQNWRILVHRCYILSPCNQHSGQPEGYQSELRTHTILRRLGH